MGRKKYWNSEAKNARWIKEGRGQGVGRDYKPWLTVRDVASQGRSHRIFGHLSRRTHHLLSDLELATFLLIQWRQSTTDIREQFPLDRELTTQICRNIGVAHPTYSGVLQYMSSDFLVSSKDEKHPIFALQVKPSSALEDQRTIEKLEVERRYWLEKQVPWYLITENQIPSDVFTNINWLYNLQSDDQAINDESKQFELYTQWVKQYSNLKIIDLCKQLDTSYSLPLGESLYQLRGMLAKRYFHFDISIPFSELRCSDLVPESVDSIVEVLHVSG
ncbi:heteromeric transposase endonuclease subunit TnsA [Hahella ganghwensis]|uniref:heteromeric transposase endonuclease subunit TnsA n=1 Tax=Hahella ganghwensis TaxID=286420 RepID=UPI0003671496|nr:heteromeric transposase endonuclease subunit TnsA [Hahella ganghwensis]